MGWLREFMAAAEQPIQSYGKLASACLEHAAWPADLRPKERSLATLFSKLDRGKDLDWLRDRIEVQLVLADLFKRPLADVRVAVGQTPSDSDERFVRLVDVRYARELDLATEDLPPGIPKEVFSPPLWQPSFWHAPSGSGRSLAAAWLRARGLAHSATISNREDLLRVPARGALFLEIEAPLGASQFQLNDEDLAQLRAGHRPLCITSAVAPSTAALTLIRSPAVDEYLPELIDWVEARLDGSGHFAPDRVEQWMRKVALPAGAARTLGDALGLIGMADEIPPRSLLAKSLDEVGEYFVKRRVRLACEATAASPRLAEVAYPALKECAARILIGGRNELLDSHDVDEWTALLSSPDSEDSPDPEWFTQALQGALGAQISRRDLRRAAKKLPPSAFQLTRALEAAGLLVRDPTSTSRDEWGAGRTLHPAWLVTLLTARATQEAVRLSPTQWGRVLLAGGRADDIIRALLDRARRGDFSAYFSVVDDYDAEETELLAALEGAIVAAGLAALDGIEVPDELAAGLLECCAQDLTLVFKLPEPRLTLSAGGLFDHHHFLAALGALCSRARFPLRHLDPLASDSLPLKHHFHSACREALKRAEPGTSRAVELLRLMAALFEEGSEARSPALKLVDSAGQASIELLAQAVTETSLDTLLAFVRSTKRSDSVFAKELWRILALQTDIGSLFGSTDAHRDFWRKASTDVLMERARSGISIEWRFLLPHQFFDWLNDRNAPPLPHHAASFLPIDAVIKRLESAGTSSFPQQTLRHLLGKNAARFCPSLRKLLESNALVDVRHILESVPHEATAVIARGLPPTTEILTMNTEAINLIQAFLLRACRQRHPDFEYCYGRIDELQARLGPLRNLS